jgi:hypothetical protein
MARLTFSGDDTQGLTCVWPASHANDEAAGWAGVATTSSTAGTRSVPVGVSSERATGFLYAPVYARRKVGRPAH